VTPTVPPSPPPPPSPRPSSDLTLVVKTTYPGTCRIVLWGPAQIEIDASKDFPNKRTIEPGTYGWRAFVDGRETGQADNLLAGAGETCSFTCDGETNTIWWGCE
jgi:hypothetical protein